MTITLFRAILAPNYRLNQFQFRQALPARLRDYVRGGGTTASGKSIAILLLHIDHVQSLEYTCGPLMNIVSNIFFAIFFSLS